MEQKSIVTFVLRIGLALRPRLTLRLSLLYLPLRLGVRLGERGDRVRRVRDGVRDSGRSTDISEYGERDLPRPRSREGDGEGIVALMVRLRLMQNSRRYGCRDLRLRDIIQY